MMGATKLCVCANGWMDSTSNIVRELFKAAGRLKQFEPVKLRPPVPATRVGDVPPVQLLAKLALFPAVDESVTVLPASLGGNL
jgi:hypothetical protein